MGLKRILAAAAFAGLLAIMMMLAAVQAGARVVGRKCGLNLP